MIKVTLRKPVQVHGDEVSELNLQEPSFEQIQKFGLPVASDPSGNFTVNALVAIKYIPELAGVPPSSVKGLGAYDVNQLCWAVWRFFMMPPETTSTPE